MPLSKFKRGDVWYLRGSVRDQHVYETTKTSDEATAEAIRIKREAELLDASVYGKKAVVSFDQAALSYLEAGGSGQFLGHFDPVTGTWDGLIGQFFGRRLHTITQADLDSFARRSRPNAKGQSRNRSVYTPFISVWNHAAKLDWCDKRAWQRPASGKVKARRFATIPEVEAMVAAAVNTSKAPVRRLAHLRGLIIFLTYTGMRLAEALELEWKDVDLEHRWCAVLKTKRDVPRGVPLHRCVVEALALTPEHRRKGRVFLTHRGQPYVDRNRKEGGQIKNSWASVCVDAKVTDLTPHCLRHTFSTWARAVGIEEHDRKLIMGHATSEMSENYTHIPQTALIEAVDLLPASSGAKDVQALSEGWRKALTCKR